MEASDKYAHLYNYDVFEPYKEEDIVSKIAITEFSADKNDTFDTFSIKENSNLNIINDDTNK